MRQYRWIFPSLLLIVLILSACQPVMPVEAGTPVDTESVDNESEIISATWDEIFVIGTADKSYVEFSIESFDQEPEFICHIGVDCTVGDIPASLYRGDRPYYSFAVPQFTIVFQLNRDYNELVLHLARGGYETSSLSVDDGEPLFVTSDMLGSRDGWVVGSYDLPLGSLQSGSHSVTFAVHDDSEGDGEYQWDALSLTAR